MLFPSIWTYYCTPLERIGLRLSIFLVLLWSLEQPSLKIDDQALRMWQKEDFKKRNTNFHCLESQFPLSVSNVCSILMDQLCWLISKLSDMGFRVCTAEPLRVSPGVRFKDSILSRSSCLEALVLRSGRHSSLPCSCTSPCVALAVLAGKAFELFQACFESPRRKDISFLRHTFKYCVTWLDVNGPVSLRAWQLLHLTASTWVFWKAEDCCRWLTSLHNVVSPALVF